MIIDDMSNIKDTVFIIERHKQDEQRSYMICQTFRTRYLYQEDNGSLFFRNMKNDDHRSYYVKHRGHGFYLCKTQISSHIIKVYKIVNFHTNLANPKLQF